MIYIGSHSEVRIDSNTLNLQIVKIYECSTWWDYFIDYDFFLIKWILFKTKGKLKKMTNYAISNNFSWRKT